MQWKLSMEADLSLVWAEKAAVEFAQTTSRWPNTLYCSPENALLGVEIAKTIDTSIVIVPQLPADAWGLARGFDTIWSPGT